jgi:hypothetical protein
VYHLITQSVHVSLDSSHVRVMSVATSSMVFLSPSRRSTL